MKRALALALLVAAPAAADKLKLRPQLSADLIYNDAVELQFEEADPNARGGDQPDMPGDTGPTGKKSLGLGVHLDASVSVEARPLPWLSLRLRPELFSQFFFDRTDAIVVRVSPPVFVQLRLHPRVFLLGASELVSNFVPNLARYTFHRETATLRLLFHALPRVVQVALDYVARIKRYPDQASWDFRAHHLGARIIVDAGAHVQLSLGYAVQLNAGAVAFEAGKPGTDANGLQHLPWLRLRLAFGAHLVEAGYQARVARGGDAAVAVDQPLLSPDGRLEEDTDEISSGGFDKHIVELTYDVRIGSRVTGDLYGRFSRKSWLTGRRDDLWMAGLTVSVRLVDHLFLDVRGIYRLNDSNAREFSFRNLILGLGVRWER